MPEHPVGREINVLALIKNEGKEDEERYIYTYDDQSARVLLIELMKQASDSELSLTMEDAAVLGQKARQILHLEEGQSNFGDGLEL